MPSLRPVDLPQFRDDVLAFADSRFAEELRLLDLDTDRSPTEAIARRRFQREGREPPPVRVIALRRPAGSSGDSGSGRTWHHRWIVRGHWRMAAVGEGRQQRRPVWISPFMKGDPDKPLLGGEKVHIVRAHRDDGTSP